jgi:hypothetical protein|tara:strand:- start:246 stop:641 length:396 start_codon:yes stop_codon:yes gene_type:complete
LYIANVTDFTYIVIYDKLLSILLFCDLFHFVLEYQIRQANSFQKTVNLIAETYPEMVSQAGLAVLAIARTLAFSCIDRLVHGIDDFGDENCPGIALQHVTTAWTPYAAHQGTLPQLGKELFQVRQGYGLPL